MNHPSAAAMKSTVWPSSRDFVDAVQNPQLTFRSAELRTLEPAVDHFGMPLVASGNFAYAFKLRNSNRSKATGVRCFRGYIADREKRYAVISHHLHAHPVVSLTSFEFDPEGILVGGHRYPITVMEWVEGPTLDLYVEQVLSNRGALEELAEQWLGVLQNLRAAQVAHGDLQHGNIIVQNGQFRLIDLDGMLCRRCRGGRVSNWDTGTISIRIAIWPSLILAWTTFLHW